MPKLGYRAENICPLEQVHDDRWQEWCCGVQKQDPGIDGECYLAGLGSVLMRDDLELGSCTVVLN